MNKLAILDKDGTLTDPASGEKFVQHPQDQVLLPGVKEAVEKLVADGYTLVIASNQGGVAAGHKSLDDAISEMYYCLSLLPEISHAFFCPDFEGKNLWSCPKLSQIYVKDTSNGTTYFQVGADGLPMMPEATLVSENKNFTYHQLRGRFRKPGPGMLLSAQIWAGATDCRMIGDRPEDSQAAEAAGIPFLDAAKWRTGEGC